MSWCVRRSLQLTQHSHTVFRRPLVCRRHVNTGAAAITKPLQYLNGERVVSLNADSDQDFAVLEPATGKTLCTARNNNADDVNRAVESASNAFNKGWRQTSGSERSKILLKAAQLIMEHREELAKVEVHDTGKPIWEARLDVDGCADAVEYFAALAANIAGQHITLPGGSFAYTRREPLGVVGGIGAWNYPFQMASWKSAPALACGNTMVFKPSQFTPLTAVMLAEIYSEAGVPKGVFNVIQGAGDTGGLLSSHPSVAKMTFTGSVPTGTKIMEACAKDIKYVTLELGGKSPVIVFDDCDLDNAVKGTMLANFLNQGQVCSNGTRVFVHRSIWEAFLDRLVTKTQAMKIGDPFSEDTTVGATISKEQFDKVMGYIHNAEAEGAKALCGGEQVHPSDPTLAGGYYISPCIMVGVSDNMTIAREEVFGPVACVFPFDTEEEVIHRANDTEFGLAGGVFTKDLQRAHRVVSRIDAGNLYINNYNVYPCQMPFGGYKKSGLGRECGSVTVDYFTQVKTVYVEMQDVECPF